MIAFFKLILILSVLISAICLPKSSEERFISFIIAIIFILLYWQHKMRINKFGQITNKSSDLLLTPEQEKFMKSLLDDGKATSLSLRYGRAIANRVAIPSTIYDTTFSSIEEAFKTLDSLEYAAEHTNDFDSQDTNLMQALQYYFGK